MLKRKMFERIDNERYESEDGRLVLERAKNEDWKGNRHWILRHADLGTAVLDSDQYRNDIAERRSLELIDLPWSAQ